MLKPMHTLKFSSFKLTLLPLVLIITTTLIASCGSDSSGTSVTPQGSNTPTALTAASDGASPTHTELTSTAVVIPESPTEVDPIPRDEPSETAPQPTSPPTDTAPPPLESWMDMPVIPIVSNTALTIYQRGLEMGRNPQAFSKVGDCQNVASMFLSIFDQPGYYSLGDYAHLQETIDWFSGSFSRVSLAVKGGFNVASVLSPLRADPTHCESGESPLACELRIHNPSFVIISMETWWSQSPEEVYEKYMRQILEYTMAQGVVPILATKADNLEGNHSINATIGKLAREYDVPLWNFWLAVQPLPNHGLQEEDNFHLTFAGNYFDDPQRMLSAWPNRNLTALQALDTVWREVSEMTSP